MNRSHAARWTALSVIAPVTAGVFAGSMVWAVNNDPREATTPVSVQVAVPPETLVVSDVDPAAAEELRRLTKRIAEVRTQTEKVLEQVTSITTESTQPASAQPAPAPQPAQPAKPAPQPAPQAPPQPAPPADTTTGAS
jgi:hypothetical protein